MAIFSVFKFKSKSKTSKFSIPAPAAPDLVASVESQPANSACRFTVDIGSVPSTEERSTDDADMGNFGFPFNIPTIIVTSEDQSSTTIAGFSVPFHKTPSKGTPVTEAESEVEDEDEASDDDDDTPVQEITGSQTYNGGVQNNNVYEKNSNNEYVHNENTTIVGDTNVEVCPAATSEGRTSDFLFSPENIKTHKVISTNVSFVLDGKLKKYHLGDVEGGSAEQTQIIWHIKLEEAMRADGMDEYVIQIATARFQMAGVATSELLK